MSSPIKVDMMFYDRQQDFWKNYQTGRPIIPDSFYQRFYDYHAANGGSFEVVYDAGAGYGELSLELGKKFKHVIVGDPAPKSLDVARNLIRAAGGSHDQYTFRQERIEDSDLPEGSVDAIFFCNGIHWTDIERAMDVMTRQLKPGGTLFICINGVPKYDPKIQSSWWKMVDACMADLGPRIPKEKLERILAIQDNGYDCVPLPESDFEPGAIRLKLNTLGDEEAFVQAPESSKNASPVQKIGPNDRLEEDIDKDWFFEVDIEGLKATIGSYPFDPDPGMLEHHISGLETLLGGGKCEGHWPVSIIMATRKKENKLDRVID